MSKNKKQGRKIQPTAEAAGNPKAGFLSEFFTVWERIAGYSSGRYAVIVAFLLLLCMVFIRYAEPLQDNDLWWHMEYGEYMVKNLTLKPDHAMYSWTIADPNWIYNGWIPEIFFYFVYAAGGTMLLHVTQYAFLMSAMALFAGYAYVLKQKFTMFHLLSMAAIFAALHINVADLRPEIFSMLLLCLTVFIYFYSKTSGKRYFYFYPLIMLVWVNSHGVFVFGIVFISALLMGEVINYFLKKEALESRMLRDLAVSVALSYAALLITPYGPKWIWSVIKSFTDARFMRQAMELLAYKPIFMFYHPVKYVLVGMAVLYGLVSVYLLVFRRYFNATITLINVLFIYFSFMYARSAYYYMPIWFFTAVYLVDKAGMVPRILKLSPVFLALFISFSAWAINWTIYYPQKYKYFGFGVGEYLPEKEADFLLEHKLEGPIFNTYEIGGYLLWRLYPHYRVFIDPRHGPYTKHLSDEYRQFEIGGNFEQFTAKYPFKTAVVKLEWIQLIHNFFKSADWRLVYFDTSAAVFVHKSVKLPDNLNVDLGPERFRDVRSYEAFIYIMYAYLNMNDFKNALYMIDMCEAKYNYGNFRKTLSETKRKIIEHQEKSKAALNNQYSGESNETGNGG